MDFAAFLTPAVVAALVAGLVALRSSERKIQMENITQERAKWRENIRASAMMVHQAAVARQAEKLSELHLTFRLLLNPKDDEDNYILSAIADLKGATNPEPRLPEFAGRVSLLLKHDWERAKHEAKPWFLRLRAPQREFYA